MPSSTRRTSGRICQEPATSGAASRRLPLSRWPRSSPEAEILDCPCGFGRHAIPLAEAGYLVTGLDRSKSQLAEAERRRDGAEWPRLVRGDYRQLPFEDASFDAVLTLFSSLGYLERDEDVGVLRELRRGSATGAHADRRDGTPRRHRPLAVERHGRGTVSRTARSTSRSERPTGLPGRSTPIA